MTKNIVRLAVGTALLLLIPLALTIRDGNVPNVGWNWSPGDFVFAFVLIFGTGLAYLLASRTRPTVQYRAGVGVALVATFLLIWINGAVGIIGDSDINALYLAVPAVLFLGSIVARLKPGAMSFVLYAAAAVQFSIPVIAYVLNVPDFSPGVAATFALNGFWVVLYVGSGLLFRQAAETPAKA